MFANLHPHLLKDHKFDQGHVFWATFMYEGLTVSHADATDFADIGDN